MLSILLVSVLCGVVGGSAWWIFGVLLKLPPPVLVIDYELTPPVETGEFLTLSLRSDGQPGGPFFQKLTGDSTIIYKTPRFWYRCTIQNKGPDTLEGIQIEWPVVFFDGQLSEKKIVASKTESLGHMLTIMGPGDSFTFYFTNVSHHGASISKSVLATARRANDRHPETLRVIESPATRFGGTTNLLFGPAPAQSAPPAPKP
jgi:hypothetical protein